jgi:hypothetical protein
MGTYITTAITALVSSCVAALFSTLITSVRIHKADREEQDEATQMIRAGLKELLWAELRKIHSDAVAQGGLSVEDRQHLESVYSAYHDGAHGNGTGTRLYQDAMNLPVLD